MNRTHYTPSQPDTDGITIVLVVGVIFAVFVVAKWLGVL